MDSDLAESINALKSGLDPRGTSTGFARAEPASVGELRELLRLPKRYCDFLLNADPEKVEIRSPSERIELIRAADLLDAQAGFALAHEGKLLTAPTPQGWRPNWIVIARSSLLGDPYFLDVQDQDAEGDCPVYAAMSGTDSWQPKLCATSFAMFLRIMAIILEVAQDFDLEDYDQDNEQVFREALGPRIRAYDPAAIKAGHWT